MTVYRFEGTNAAAVGEHLIKIEEKINSAKVLCSVIDDILAEARPENCGEQTQKAEIVLASLLPILEQIEEARADAHDALGKPILYETAE